LPGRTGRARGDAAQEKAMGIRVRFGTMSRLLGHEAVLLRHESFRAVTGACFPNYRIGFPVPMLWRITLYVTSRRCLVVSRILGVFIQEVDTWYPGKNPRGRTDLITGVSVKRGLFGRCLELRSRDPKRPCRWLCCPAMTLRFFFRIPERVERAIHDAMRQRLVGGLRLARKRA